MISMNIGIDIRSLMERQRTGVGEYTLNLLKELFKLDSENQYYLFYNGFKQSKFSIGNIVPDSPEFDSENIHYCGFKYPNKLLNFGFRFLKYPKIDRMIEKKCNVKIDLFFLPNHCFYSLSDKVKLILTVHDLSFVRLPELLNFKKRLWHKIINPARICQRAHKIVAVSESTKKDLIQLYGLNPDKIFRMHSGISADLKRVEDCQELNRVKQKYSLPEKFILFLGTIEPRKNTIGAIKSYEEFKRIARDFSALKEYSLVIVGPKGWKNRGVFKAIKTSPFKSQIKYIGYLDAEDKSATYSLANLFLFPSFYEGFGFPALEAMKCGTPVVTSYNSSLVEVTGDSSILINPYNISEISQAIFEILSDEKLKINLITKGKSKVEKFNWQKTASEFLNLIN